MVLRGALSAAAASAAALFPHGAAGCWSMVLKLLGKPVLVGITLHIWWQAATPFLLVPIPWL